MADKHKRKLALPRGEYFVPAGTNGEADISLLHARRNIVNAIERSSIPRKLEASVDEAWTKVPKREDIQTTTLLSIVDSWIEEWKLKEWMVWYGMLWFRWGAAAADAWEERQADLVATDSHAITDDEAPPVSGRCFASLYTEDFALAIPGCDLAERSFASWAAEVRREVEDQLFRIEEDSQNRAITGGWRRTRTDKQSGTKRRRRSNETKYYDWFVRFQLAKETYEKIADDEGFDRATVVEAIHSVARAARVTLRTGGRIGRPRKTVSNQRDGKPKL